MKLIIDADEKIVRKGFEQPLTEEERATLIRAIGNGIPYNSSGDAISREIIEKVIVGILEKWGDGYPYIEIPTGDAIKIMKSAISEIPPVETKQDELLDYIKLSLKQSDEFKEKYRNEYEESNCQYDLYYSHLFEGMSEAYDDLLKKMGESDIQGKQDRLRGSTE